MVPYRMAYHHNVRRVISLRPTRLGLERPQSFPSSPQLSLLEGKRYSCFGMCNVNINRANRIRDMSHMAVHYLGESIRKRSHRNLATLASFRINR